MLLKFTGLASCLEIRVPRKDHEIGQRIDSIADTVLPLKLGDTICALDQLHLAFIWLGGDGELAPSARDSLTQRGGEF